MSKLSFSKGKFANFFSSKGFYVAVAVCLVGATGATWLAVDQTIGRNQDNNTQVIESENQWNNYPEVESTAKKQAGVLQSNSNPSSASSSSAQSASSRSAQSAPASVPTDKSEPSGEQVNSLSLVYALPVKSEVIQSFSNGELVKNMTLNDWRTHDGIDIAAEKGTDVMSCADGTISDITNDSLWGTTLTIDHADGHQSVYCGLDKALPIAVGDVVTRGQVIGSVEGVPCEVTLPSHMHFGVKKDGQWIDPITLLQKEVVD